jgi:23S rRNA A2030 N6-methylase RlmJ
MNYRHQFHAGNFADVVKHALLVALARALQRKDKGCLLLDTHAGRGRYDLAAAAAGPKQRLVIVFTPDGTVKKIVSLSPG